MNPIHLSGIARMIDVRHPSNLFIVAATAAAGIGAMVWRVAGPGDDVLRWGLLAGGAVFLAWAIARELDPDHPTGALVAAVVALPLLALGAPSLAAAAAILLATRIAARTTGRSPTPIDAAVLIGLGGYVGLDPTGWPAAAALTGALVVDGTIHRGPRRSLFVGMATAAAAIGAAVLATPEFTWQRPTAIEGLLVVAALLAGAAFTRRATAPVSVCDIHGRPLSAGRVASAAWLALVAVAAALAFGSQGVAAMSITMAALVGTGVAARVAVVRSTKPATAATTPTAD